MPQKIIKTQTDFLLEKEELTHGDIVYLLQANQKERQKIFKRAAEIKQKYVGNKVYYRGLIEFSNICSKDCFYCGIRRSNKHTNRYLINEEAILQAVKFAHDNRYGSVVFQAGERSDKEFIELINRVLKRSKELTNNEIGITISLGEQTYEVYKRWFGLGAHRYLLRIESATQALYEQIHPKNKKHSFQERIKALRMLQKAGYQTGTGVMIGLPNQTYEHLANDILFFKDLGIDMVGMGAYIEHKETPMFEKKDSLLPLNERFTLSLKMIAILRIVMKDINIAAATALQAIDPLGREKAIKVGANIIMPNITPTVHRADYQLYENKPCIDEGADDCTGCLEARINLAGAEVGYGEWGDSPHYAKRIANNKH